jgi:DNA (cytosine-5)-methyltransferase 1
MEKKVVELFAGVGGFRVGLNNIKEFDKQTGLAIEKGYWDFVWANQWEPSTKSQPAFECYTKRFGNSPNHVNEDISKVDKYSIPDHTLLVGGFPCQDYSVARSLSGEKGIEGKKGVLWWQIYEILEVKKTPFVLLENVDRLLKSPAKQRGRDFGVMLRALNDLGYGVEWRVINAAEYGMPQRRRRVFIFAYHESTNYYKDIKKYESEELIYQKGLFAKSFKLETDYSSKHKDVSVDINKYIDIYSVSDTFTMRFRNTGVMIDGKVLSIETKPNEHSQFQLRELLISNVPNKYYLTEKQIKKFEYLKGPKRIERLKPNGEPYTYSEGGMSFPDNLNLPGRTMLTSESSINRSTHVVRNSPDSKLRFITPIEAERMNTFPDDWTKTGMTEKQRYFMMGNALVCEIVFELSMYISKIIEAESD